ncbi:MULTISPECIES: SDR family oxidoreductase [unclassified Frankia]|uniref:SDR family oxidoreductase n=1 Tax=unclassified Frankia TaxID=2632575 RepID=UPI002AD1FDFC|nr:MULTISPECIES: SDR family oxidoreductase [unclassified Frankia]
MDLGLKDKVAVVAGGSRGCGRAISVELAKEGAAVVLTGRQPDIVEATAEQIESTGGSALGVVADMTTTAGALEIIEAARRAFGAPDILVTNPPGPLPGDDYGRGFLNCSDEDFLRTNDQFIMSQVYLTREVIPNMMEKGWGRLVNIASICLKTPHHRDPLVLANLRVGVAGMMKTLAEEYGEHGITANIVATGPFRSELAEDYLRSQNVKDEAYYAQEVPVRRWGRPAEMGALVAFLCSEQAAFLTGETIRLDGGYSKSLF